MNPASVIIRLLIDRLIGMVRRRPATDADLERAQDDAERAAAEARYRAARDRGPPVDRHLSGLALLVSATLLADPAPAADTTTPAWCAAVLAGPPPDTMERARQVIECERLTAAAALDQCATGLRLAREELARPRESNGALWFVVGAAVATLAIVVTVQAAP